MGVEEETARSNSVDAGRRRGEKPRPRKAPLSFALRMLARRAHSEGELTGKMARAGYRSDELETALEFLRARHSLDDHAFALGFARRAVQDKRWGPLRIAQALGKRQLSQGLIEAALEEAFPDGEPPVCAQAFARFQRVDGGRGTVKERRARAYRHLLGRGFSPEVVYSVIEAPLDG